VSGRRGFLDDPPPPAAPLAGPPRGWLPGEGDVGPVGDGAATAQRARRAPAPPLAALGGLALLLLALLGLDLANFLADQFARSTALGLLTLALVVPPLGLLGWATRREWQGYAALGRAEGLQRALSGEDATAARSAAVAWLEAVAAAPDSLRAVQAAPDAATVRALLRAGPALARLDDAVAREGRAAAVEALALTAVSPWPGLDGALVAWRGMRLVRRVAELHGMRPGAFGTLRLFRRVALDAGMVAAADVAVGAAAEALLQSPLAGGLAGGAAGSAVAARRMLTLAQATARACRPVA